MAFGFFNKKNTADTIFMNGHIFTQDHALPWCSAVACRNGKIMAVGDFDAMDDICGDDTQVIDLEEKYMFPGFIDAHGTPVLKAFEGMYLSIDPMWDLDTVLEAVADYAQSCDDEVLFAYGYNERILADYDEPEEIQALLDEVVGDRPLMILGAAGVFYWVNTCAFEQCTAVAEDEGIQYMTPGVVLNILTPFDFEEVEAKVGEVSTALADKGITSVLNLGAPDYLASLYQDSLLAMVGENAELKQRFLGTTYVTRPLNPQVILHTLGTNRTNCMELGGVITHDFLKIELCQYGEEAFFSQNALDTICQAVGEHGYNIHIDAPDREASQMAYDSLCHAREKGCRKNTFVLATDYLPEDFDEEREIVSTWPTDNLNVSVFDRAGSVAEAIDLLTTDAARLVGMEDKLGMIEQGRLADFTVFEENPFDKNLSAFSKMHAAMTVIDGMITYDLDEECEEEMCDLLLSMRL